jgi:hypothetical protein
MNSLNSLTSLKPLQRATCLALAALMSVAIAETIIGHAFDADPQMVVAKADRAPAPAEAPLQQLAQAGPQR